jgi:uncharacterized protein
MFIAVHELELHRVEFDQEYRPAVLDLGTEISQVDPLFARGHAELLEERHAGKGKPIQDIRLVGRLSTRVEVACARCLEPVSQNVKREFDLLYRPQGIDGGHEELSVTDAEAEIGYYTGDGLLLEEVLREQVLLSLPLRTLCGEECKGLCPQCGKNLNQGACQCERPPDPRWQALGRLKDQLGK